MFDRRESLLNLGQVYKKKAGGVRKVQFCASKMAARGFDPAELRDMSCAPGSGPLGAVAHIC
jgi:hypothetical protein